MSKRGIEGRESSEITTIFWDAGNVLFPDAHLWFADGSVYQPVLKALGLSLEEAERIFHQYNLHDLWLGRITEDIYWQTYIKQSPLNPGLEDVKRSYRRCIQPN